MPSLLPIGPIEHRLSADGRPFPYYIVPFDKHGECEGPLTQQHLLDHLEGYSDIFLFSHGWNNDWDTARNRYTHFINGYIEQRHRLNLAATANYRPLLVGVFWPSQALAWFDSETGPGFAGTVDQARQQLEDIGSTLPAGMRSTFRSLAQAPELGPDEARELAQLLAGALQQGDDEALGPDAPSADDLLHAAYSLTGEEPVYGDVGNAATPSPSPGGTPATAGVLSPLKALDPRQLIKPFTVWQMKDRAGVVGSLGVSRLLDGLLERSDEQTRIHLLGHSFGCKILMSAVAALPAGARKVYSALLLQPAISQYAFADQVPGSNRTGGYHGNLSRIERPILATYSDHDVALSKTFHLALRRDRDLGEQPQSAGSPSRYGALGGFGPQPPGGPIIEIKDAPAPYEFGAGGRVIGIQGSRAIHGHGCISNPWTWWLAYSLVTS